MRAKIIATEKEKQRIGINHLDLKDQFYEVEQIGDGYLHSVKINDVKWTVPTHFLEFEFGRDEFMQLFRNIYRLNELSVDDRVEVFSTILLGSSDFTAELLNNIFNDYCIDTLDVVEYPYNFNLETHQKELEHNLRVMERIINAIDESLNKEEDTSDKMIKNQIILTSISNIKSGIHGLKYKLLNETN